MFARRKPIKHPLVRPFGFDVGFLRHFFRTTPVHWPQGAERVLTLTGSADYSCAPGVMRNLVVQALDRGMGVWHFGCQDPKSVHYLSQQADKKSFLGNVACVVIASIEDELSVLHDATVCLADFGPVLSLGRNTKGSLRKGNHRQHLIVSPVEDASLGKIEPMISQGSYRATHLASRSIKACAPIARGPIRWICSKSNPKNWLAS